MHQGHEVRVLTPPWKPNNSPNNETKVLVFVSAAAEAKATLATCCFAPRDAAVCCHEWTRSAIWRCPRTMDKKVCG